MTPERTEKFKKVAQRRQGNLTIILENVHDPHNIGAVLRSCDSVGIKEIFVLYTEPALNRERLEIGSKSSSGARKWIDVHFYTDIKACFKHVKSQYDHILSTHLAEDSKDLYELDLTQSIALMFGNEHSGISDEAQQYSNGNFIIPQVGMVKSLNISVACAVTIYEAYRQRKAKGFYDENLVLTKQEQDALFDEYERRHEARMDIRSVPNLSPK